MNRKIIFLDVDGPLNTNRNKYRQHKMNKPTSSYHIELPYKQLANLKEIVLATGADIVLSSKWRLLDERLIGSTNISPARLNLEKQLSKYGMTIYSQTPFINHMRGAEITKWLNNFTHKHGYLPSYIIIDDVLYPILEEHRGHIVYCDPNKGIGKNEVEVAISLFRRQECNYL